MAKQQKEITNYTDICKQYAPYNKLPEFEEGATAYLERKYENPYSGVLAQAWDRGAEAAMKYTRQFE